MNEQIIEDTEHRKHYIRPCPFCGGGEFEMRANGSFWTGTRTSPPVSYSLFHWCENAPLQNRIERRGKFIADVIDLWNNRVDNDKNTNP